MPSGARLVVALTLIAFATQAHSGGGRDNPPTTYRVEGVAAAEPLNLRAGPGTGARVLVEIPHDARGLSGTGRTRRVGSQRWREVTFQQTTGWVNDRFLALDTAVDRENQPSDEAAPGSAPSPETSPPAGEATQAGTPLPAEPVQPLPPVPPGEIACHSEVRPVTNGNETQQVKGYTCRSEAGPLFRIEHVALSEFAASKLLFHQRADGTSIKIDEVVGTPRLIPTKVSERAKELFETYGALFKVSDLWNVNDEDEISALGGSEGKVRLLRAPFSVTYSGPDAGGIDIPNLDEQRQVRKSQSWPAQFKQSYYPRNAGICSAAINSSAEQTGEQHTSMLKAAAADCVIVWRYAAPEDLDNVARDIEVMRELELDVGLSDFPRLSRDFDQGNHAKFLDLMRALAKERWPEDWLVLFAMPNGCGQAAFRFAFLSREIKLQTLTIENLSGSDLELGALIGSTLDGSQLRPLTSEPPAGATAVGQAIGRLQVGEKVAVPIGVIFRQDDELHAEPDHLKKMFDLIKTLPPDTAIDGNEGFGAKLISSYKPPEMPTGADYAWGPEIHVTSIEAGGKTIAFTPAEPERIDLTVDGGSAASCPYLASWDEDAGDWVLHRKVIQSADGPARETSETIPLDKFRSRLRLQELEMEVAHINHAAMKIETTSGRVHWLAPRQPALLFRDKRYVSIHAGESVELEFKLPVGVSPEHVLRSSFVISGYYRRYADMLVTVNDDEARTCHAPRMTLAGN